MIVCRCGCGGWVRVDAPGRRVTVWSPAGNGLTEMSLLLSPQAARDLIAELEPIAHPGVIEEGGKPCSAG